MVTQDRPVVCVSYLASAELWSVSKFPTANQGAEIRTTEHSIAGDAPMAAAVLAALEVPTLLVSNRIGNDDVGGRVGGWLQQRAVPMATVASADVSTPRIVVVADDEHTRTWFAHLPGVAEELSKTNLSHIAKASLVYLDAYRLIEEAAVRVVQIARQHCIQLFINLGGEPLSRELRIALAGYRDLVIQTNVDDRTHRTASTVAREILDMTCADWVIVTAGAYGSVAVSRGQYLTTSAFRVDIRHTHCAGAAFSGGLLYGLYLGLPMARSMLLGSASGALRCARPQNAPLPTLLEIEAVIATLSRSSAN
ncbi:carbohydrate kinase family protein [Nocardia africana]|uniref:Carbohydrate kinase family protein n=1 Tax=Nocardia africana TaxID=134964 RepID=A0ABW6NU76_9NOCA